MTKFNPNIFNDPLGGLALQYGVPSCMVDMSKEVLALLPGDILGGMQVGMAQGRAAAESFLADITKKIFDDLGIIEFNTQTGQFIFTSESAGWGSDGYLGNVLGSTGEFLGQVLGFGGALWKNYEVLSDQIEVIQNCLGKFEDWLDKGENKADVTSVTQLAASFGRFEAYKSQALDAEAFVTKVDSQILAIDEINSARVSDPSLIPEFEDEDTQEEDTSPIFRLTFGPPKSKKGQFLLSVDGLYYDSQNRDYAGGVVPGPEDIGFVAAEDKWELDHAPSLGGRGTSYSINDLNKYVDTIFDPDVIDDSDNLTSYYKSDHLLDVINSNKTVRVDHLNDTLSNMISEGYSITSALYINLLQQLNSEVAAFDSKLNKRKKQIEVAVKAPDLFGSTTKFSPGEIPINDFSYLSSINLDVEVDKQKGLVFDHGEVSGIILPVQPLFVKAEGSQQGVVITPLNVGEVGAGSMLDGEELEGDAPILSLTNGIAVDSLISVYNFTDANLVDPDSQEFNTLNCGALGTEHRAQLVSRYPTTIYAKGLGVPYLNGIVSVKKKNSYVDLTGETWASQDFKVDDTNNFLKLPDDQEFQDLMYSASGCTIDFWTYMPGIKQEKGGWWEHPYDNSAFDFKLSSSDSKWLNGHFNRVLMGCENTGGRDNSISPSGVIADRSSDFVRGMLMGFSRDPKIYYRDGPVTRSSTDVDIRTGFGYSASAITVDDASTDFDTIGVGEWVVSSDITGDILDAAGLPSGTYEVTSTVGPGGGDFITTFLGDGIHVSANLTEYKILLTPDHSDTIRAVSATVGLSHLANPVELYMGVPSAVFFIAPTQSYNSSAVGFVKAGDCDSAAAQVLRFTSTLDKNVSGVSLSSLASEFMHMSVVFDPIVDEIRLYVDSILYETDSISNVFNVKKGAMPQVPSLISPSSLETSSFFYKSPELKRSGLAVTNKHFEYGPTTYPFFTPWVLGGGWTDGRPVELSTSSGGFLSPGDGIISSYNGYVGSLKIYCKALDTEEITSNFKTQKTFFKNIDV